MQERKPLTDMSDEELLAEIERLNSIRPPAARKATQPPRKRDVKPKAHKAGWRSQLFGEDE